MPPLEINLLLDAVLMTNEAGWLGVGCSSHTEQRRQGQPHLLATPSKGTPSTWPLRLTLLCQEKMSKRAREMTRLSKSLSLKPSVGIPLGSPPPLALGMDSAILVLAACLHDLS